MNHQPNNTLWIARDRMFLALSALVLYADGVKEQLRAPASHPDSDAHAYQRYIASVGLSLALHLSLIISNALIAAPANRIFAIALNSEQADFLNTVTDAYINAVTQPL